MYQVGLMETDQHIEFFWGALEMFTQEELCKFIKFACNQERIPFTCPCKDGGPDTAHVPPYPMKIAPPDGTAGTVVSWCRNERKQIGVAEPKNGVTSKGMDGPSVGLALVTVKQGGVNSCLVQKASVTLLHFVLPWHCDLKHNTLASCFILE